MITGNKGEWSEIYTFLKLLAEGKLYAADKNLKKIRNIYYPILKILRSGKKGGLEYVRNGDIKVVDSKSQKTLLKIPLRAFKKQSLILLKSIKKVQGGSGSFSCLEVEKALEKIKVRNIKSPSGKKEDITLVVHDLKTGFDPTLSFSIKSKLGGASTLLNPSKSTNFIYTLEKNNSTLQEPDAEYQKTLTKRIRDKLMQKKEKGYKFKFVGISSDVFNSNLVMIDSGLPEILGNLTLNYYLGLGPTIKKITRQIEKENPLNFCPVKGQKFYEHKVKNLLMDIALGMTPARPWKGYYDATGGYIVVRKDGEVVCYHIYNINEFKDYLFNHTKLDTPSTDRHNHGDFYTRNGKELINLNLQIRFIS
jgi:hypothetical protein